MNDEYATKLEEIHEMLKAVLDRQDQLMESMKELKEQQKKLQEEIKINYLVLNSLPSRNEILN